MEKKHGKKASGTGEKVACLRVEGETPKESEVDDMAERAIRNVERGDQRGKWKD